MVESVLGWEPRLTVLVDEHSDADAAHVEPVEEVLYVVLGGGVHLDALFHLDHTLGHCLHHTAVPVPDLDQGLTKTADNMQRKGEYRRKEDRELAI